MLEFRANNCKVAGRLVKDRVTKKNFRTKYDIYLVDYAVIGSSKGASYDPEFHVITLCEKLCISSYQSFCQSRMQVLSLRNYRSEFC